jgi:hypothetical protein
VKHQKSAAKRLLSTRWQHDATEKAVDPFHDGNGFSFYYRSRLDIHLPDGKKWDCENLRKGCKGMSSHDGFHGTYSYLTIDTRKDGRATHHVPKGTGLYLPDAK